MRKTYISATHLQSEVKQILLSDNNYALGTSVHPNSYLFNYQDHLELQFLAYNKLKKLNLNVLKEIISFPKTVKTLLSFINEMKLYTIQIDDLPNKTKVEQEIKESIELLFSLVETPVVLNDKSYVVSTGLNHSAYHYTKKHHLNLAEVKEPESVRYLYAQNKRQELEAMIQDIIAKDLKSVCIVVPNKNDSLALIESIMKRYGLKGELENRNILIAKQQFYTYFDFLNNPSHRNFLKALEQNVFHLYYPQDVLTYVKHYNLQFTQDIPNDLCSSDDKRSALLKIQKRAENDLDTLSTLYSETSTLNYQEKFEHVYMNLFKVYNRQMMPYKTYYETYFDYIKVENHPLILDHILSFNSKTSLPKGWNLVDYNSLPLSKQENIYLISLNAQHFPNVVSKNGLIDETYLSQIDAYPDLQTRSNYELENKRRIYSLGENITFSHHIANYEGKGVEASFEIKDFFKSKGIKEASIWPLHQIRYREIHKAKLTPSIAKKLFAPNDKIAGSVSSIQKYARDPLLYFMENGLYLREEDDTSFNPMVFGTLNHEIIENKLDETNQVSIEETWDKLIWPSFPKDSQLLKLIQERNNKSILMNIDYLMESNKHNSLNCLATEELVKSDHTFNNISFKGYVDRIDATSDVFAIIDYKSSDTGISEPELIRGTQLQLLSYAALIKEEKNLKPFAVLNYAFKNPNKIDDKLQRYQQSKGIVNLDEINAKDLWNNEKRYKGWFFEDPADFINTAAYWTGLTDAKEGGIITPKSVYDFEKVEKLLQNRYAKLYKSIISGILDVDDLDMELEEKPKLKKELR